MPSPIEASWLIPIPPFFGGILIGILLLSFSRTMNRLSKPVAFILISCISMSAIISYLLLFNEFSEELVKEYNVNFNPYIKSENLQLNLIVDKTTSIIFSVVSTLSLFGMIGYHFLMYRKPNYVIFFILFSIVSSSLLGISLTEFANIKINQFLV
tara:strand:+ start:1609 stop:2073 length:465 start_codon:yes stop_codon:yes gene_type:complete